MKMISLLFAMLPCLVFGYNNPDAKTIMNEYQEFRSMVSTMDHDYLAGGWYKAKRFGETTLLWNLRDDISKHEVIRFFRKKDDGSVFTVTYHRSQSIVPGRIVLRRFVGPEPTGWVNHTIDFETGEHLGSQGWWPIFDESDHEFMKEWGFYY